MDTDDLLDLVEAATTGTAPPGAYVSAGTLTFPTGDGQLVAVRPGRLGRPALTVDGAPAALTRPQRRRLAAAYPTALDRVATARHRAADQAVHVRPATPADATVTPLRPQEARRGA